MLRSRIAWPAILAAALCLASASSRAEPVQTPQDNSASNPGVIIPATPSGPGLAPGSFDNTAVGGGTNGNIGVVNSVLSGVGCYVGNPWGSMNDTQRQAAINNAANWGFTFIAPKIATSGGTTWYSSTAQLDNWILWCTQAGIKFFPWSYVNPSTGGTGTTIATNRAAAIAAEIAQHNGIVMVDMEAEWQLTIGAYGPNMTAFGTAYRSACPNIPIVVTGFSDPGTVQGSQWPYAEMRSFADAYAPQWYYPWWSWYRNTKGVSGVKNAIDTCYSQVQTYFGSAYPVVPNGAWENDRADAVTPASLPDLYAGTAYMKKFDAPIIWWEYSYLTRAIASALVGYGYFTDQPVPTGSPARPAAIVASATSVPGGGNVTFTINVGGPAPVGGQSIGLTTTNTNALPVPASVTIPRGASSVDVVVTTGMVATSTPATITASNNATGVTVTTAKTITVTQSGFPLTGFTLNPTVVASSDSSTGTLTISAPAPATGEVIAVSSNNANVTVPAGGVSIPGGETTATFPITTKANVASLVNATITAGWGANSIQAPFTVTPVGISTLTLNPVNIVAGQTSVGTITLLGPAPSTGMSITLSSDNANVTVPAAGVNVAPGESTATFSISTSPSIAATAFVKISAGYNGITVPATLTVNPISVSTLSLSADTIRGSNTCTGTVTLIANAPVGGVDVTVASDATDIATVVTPVNVPEGQKSAQFAVTGANVAYTASANITASLNGGTATQSVTVRPRHDVNGDDVFDLNDVPAALRIVAGLSGIQGDQIVAVDVDGSGVADMADVVALLRLALSQ